MPRRYHHYPAEFQIWQVTSSLGAVVLAFAYLFPLFYLGWSLFRGERAPDNPWDATGLEWQTRSPPPTDNFDYEPVVTAEPYGYHPEHSAPDEVTQAHEPQTP
jgi:cytochrome c oxidase subunit 1